MAAQLNIRIIDVENDESIIDALSDEKILQEGIDFDDFLSNIEPATQDLWDVLEISSQDWMDAQPDGFFMP